MRYVTFRKVYGSTDTSRLRILQKEHINENEIPVEKRFNKKQLERIYNAIHYTREFKAKEAAMRFDE